MTQLNDGKPRQIKVTGSPPGPKKVNVPFLGFRTRGHTGLWMWGSVRFALGFVEFRVLGFASA